MAGSPQARGPFDSVMQSQAVSNAVQSQGDPYMDARRRSMMTGLHQPFDGMAMMRKSQGTNPDMYNEVLNRYR